MEKNTKKRLFLIFGPVITAVLMIGILFFAPFQWTNYSSVERRDAAVSISDSIFKGKSLKDATINVREGNDPVYVPFFGSSEWSRMDVAHPSVLADKYDRKYRPFLLGSRGSQSITQYMNMQTMLNGIDKKKAVFLISPQWFVKDGENPQAFQKYYSKLSLVEWILNNKNKDTKQNKYFVKRLEFYVGKNNSLVRLAKKAISHQKLSYFEELSLKLQYWALLHEDQFFSQLRMKNNYDKKIVPKEKLLPNKFDYREIQKVVDKEAKKNTNNNPFGIDNKFYTTRVKNKIEKLKGSQCNYNYVKSPEYADFEMILNQFAQSKTEVLFIIPPVNAKWEEYTGLDMDMYQNAVSKLIYQLQSQGFNNIVDLSNDGGKKYFMQDTIHVGWRGWLAIDKYVNPFLNAKYKEPSYSINDYFYSKEWQNKE